jgi:hypothetical protein
MEWSVGERIMVSTRKQLHNLSITSVKITCNDRVLGTNHDA